MKYFMFPFPLLYNRRKQKSIGQVQAYLVTCTWPEGQGYGKQQLRPGEREASARAQLRAAVTLRPEVVAPSRF